MTEPQAEPGLLLAETFEVGAPGTREKALAFITAVTRLEAERTAECLIVLPEINANQVTIRVFQARSGASGSQPLGVRLGDLLQSITHSADAIQLNTPQGSSARSGLSLPDA